LSPPDTRVGKEKKISIPDGIPIVTFGPATEADLRPGATVFVPAQRGDVASSLQASSSSAPTASIRQCKLTATRRVVARGGVNQRQERSMAKNEPRMCSRKCAPRRATVHQIWRLTGAASPSHHVNFGSRISKRFETAEGAPQVFYPLLGSSRVAKKFTRQLGTADLDNREFAV
jgi:hypothetical protein